MYLLVTPVRNEEDNIPDLIESVRNQSITPLLWVFADDNSTDATAHLIKQAMKQRDYIHYIKSGEVLQYGHSSYAKTVRAGFSFAVNYAIKKGIAYDYLGLLDADAVPEKTYFEKLIHALQASEKLGIVSGQLYLVRKGKHKPENLGNWPRGPARLHKRQCFEEIGGWPESTNPDTVSNIKAELRGWQIGRVMSAKCIHKRKVSSKGGVWYRYSDVGKGAYYLNYHPVYALLNGLYIMMTNVRFYCGIAYLLAYFKALLRKDVQYHDAEITKYFSQSVARLKKKIKVRITNKLKGSIGIGLSL